MEEKYFEDEEEEEEDEGGVGNGINNGDTEMDYDY